MIRNTHSGEQYPTFAQFVNAHNGHFCNPKKLLTSEKTMDLILPVKGPDSHIVLDKSFRPQPHFPPQVFWIVSACRKRDALSMLLLIPRPEQKYLSSPGDAGR